MEIENEKVYTKSAHDPQMLKQIAKIKNHRYLACLSQRPVNKLIIENSLKKYNEPLFPLMLNLQNTEGVEFKSVPKRKMKTSCTHLPELKKSTQFWESILTIALCKFNKILMKKRSRVFFKSRIYLFKKVILKQKDIWNNILLEKKIWGIIEIL